MEGIWTSKCPCSTELLTRLEQLTYFQTIYYNREKKFSNLFEPLYFEVSAL